MNKQWICCVLRFCCELVVCFLRMYVLVSFAQSIISSTLFVSESSSERPLGLVDVESARELLLHE